MPIWRARCCTGRLTPRRRHSDMNLILAILEVVFPKKRAAALQIAEDLAALQGMFTEGHAKDRVDAIERSMAIIRRWPPK